MASLLEQDAERVADIWHQLSDLQREHLRRDCPALGEALDDLLETLVEE